VPLAHAKPARLLAREQAKKHLESVIESNCISVTLINREGALVASVLAISKKAGESDEVTGWAERISRRMDRLPEEPEECFRAITDIVAEFKKQLAQKLEPSINQLVKQNIDSDSEGKRKCASLVNYVLNVTGLAIACPEFHEGQRIAVGTPCSLITKTARSSSWFVLKPKSPADFGTVESKNLDGSLKLTLLEHVSLPPRLDRTRAAEAFRGPDR
jgi:hypothetical protein